MKKLLLLLLCVPLIGLGQEFEQTFNPNGYTDAFSAKSLQTSDGGYIIYSTGFNNSGPPGPNWVNDAVLIKKDMYGTQQWLQIFDDGDYDWASDFIETSDGGFLLLKADLEWSWPASNTNGAIIKTDGNGNQIWKVSTSIRVNEFSDIIQTSDGGYIYIGYKSIDTSLNQLTQQISVVKLDALGNEIWVSDNLGPQLNGIACSIEETDFGAYIIAGAIGLPFASGDNAIIIKLDNNGNQQWERTFPLSGLIHNIKETPDGGFITSGARNDGGERLIFIMKTDNNGFQLWYKEYPSDVVSAVDFHSVWEHSLSDIIITNDGGYALTSSVWPNFEYDPYKLCLLKIDGQGNKEWIKTYNLNNNYYVWGNSIELTFNGGYIISGGCYGDTTSGSIQEQGIYLIRTNSQGNVTSTFNIPTPSSNRRLEKVVDILGRDINPEKNNPFIEIYNDGTVEKKIIIE